jgi:uncharacterized protein (TIGR03435 family)
MPYESLAQILRRAFGLPRPQVAAPEWTEFRHFSIDARVPEGASADDVPAMLLSMLSERFHMTYHSEVRNTAVLLLTLAKGGLKAEPSPEQPRPRSWLIGELGRHYELATTSAGLADFLKQRSSFPVNDTTGLAGSYLFSFDFYPFGKQGADGKYVGLPTGDFLTSQAVRYDEALAPLGLRLTLSKMRLDNIIIDHIDRVPTEN